MEFNILGYKYPFNSLNPSNRYIIFFSIHPLSRWSYDDFLQYATFNNQNKKTTTLLSAYKHCLQIISNNSFTPEAVKNHVKNLLSQANESDFNKASGSSTNLFISGDIIEGDKVNGDKVLGDKVVSDKACLSTNEAQNGRKRSLIDVNDNEPFINNSILENNDNYDVASNEKESWDSINAHKKRKARYNYLGNEFDSSCIINPSMPCFMVDGTNISNFLNKFRQKSIKGAQLFKDISDSRILSLSYVYLFNIQQHSSCTHRLDKSIHSAIITSLNIKQYWTPLPDDTFQWCIQLDQQISSSSTEKGLKNAKKLIRQLQLQYDNDNDDDNVEITLDLLYAIVDRFQHWNYDCFLECNFINQHITPFMVNIFEKNSLLMGKQGESYVSRNINNEDDNTATLMADYTIFYQSNLNKNFDLFVVEVKPIGKSCGSQVQSDLVKLGKEMKRMVDFLVAEDIDQITVCGMLVKGIECSTYKMDLEYDGMYRMVQLGGFHLLRNETDILLTPKIIQHLIQVKNYILKTANSINEKYKNIITDKAVQRRQWKRRSSITPTKKNTQSTSSPHK